MLASEYYSPITTTRSAIQYYHPPTPSLPPSLPRASLTQERKINFHPMFAIILECQYDHVWQVPRNFYIVIPITISRYWPRKGLPPHTHTQCERCNNWGYHNTYTMVRSFTVQVSMSNAGSFLGWRVRLKIRSQVLPANQWMQLIWLGDRIISDGGSARSWGSSDCYRISSAVLIY